MEALLFLLVSKCAQSIDWLPHSLLGARKITISVIRRFVEKQVVQKNGEEYNFIIQRKGNSNRKIRLRHVAAVQEDWRHGICLYDPRKLFPAGETACLFFEPQRRFCSLF